MAHFKIMYIKLLDIKLMCEQDFNVAAGKGRADSNYFIYSICEFPLIN